MKKVLFSLAAAAAVTVLLSGCGAKGGSDKSLEQIKAKGVFVVGLDDAFPPMGFREKGSNEIVGFDIDLAKKAAEKLGVKVEFKPVALLPRPAASAFWPRAIAERPRASD